MDCFICFESYEKETKIVVGNCGHSICLSCRQDLSHICPICEEDFSFNQDRRNFLAEDLVGIIENISQTQSFYSTMETTAEEEKEKEIQALKRELEAKKALLKEAEEKITSLSTEIINLRSSTRSDSKTGRPIQGFVFMKKKKKNSLVSCLLPCL